MLRVAMEQRSVGRRDGKRAVRLATDSLSCRSHGIAGCCRYCRMLRSEDGGPNRVRQRNCRLSSPQFCSLTNRRAHPERIVWRRLDGGRNGIWAPTKALAPQIRSLCGSRRLLSAQIRHLWHSRKSERPPANFHVAPNMRLHRRESRRSIRWGHPPTARGLRKQCSQTDGARWL